MGFSQANGYIPATIEDIMDYMMAGVNDQQGTSYTTETFLGTQWYKFYYTLAQRLQENEVKTSEIFEKLQQYIGVTNERISRPVGTSPGIVEKLLAEGYTASVKPPIDADAGKIYICVDTDNAADDYAATKLDINTIIKDSIAAGIISQGAESSTIVLSNGQSFAFKFALPDRHIVKLKLTLTLSENNQVEIDTPEVIKQRLLDNIIARYQLGLNFEPQKYFSTEDAPWASIILLEWSSDWDPGPATYHSTVFDADFDDLYDVRLENITLVEA